MRALDVMTANVVTVPAHATVQDVARLFVAHRISAAPVVDSKGNMVGIVSEGDLLRRAELGTERRRSWWLDLITTYSEQAAEYVRSHAQRVTDVMTKEVISVDEATPIADIAELLESRHIKRVPVVRDGKPVGIVSRANLVQALASLAPGADTRSACDDQVIRSQLLEELGRQKWSIGTPANIVVHDGVIHLWGFVLSEQEQHALRVAAENVPGVKAVEDHTSLTPLMPVG